MARCEPCSPFLQWENIQEWLGSNDSVLGIYTVRSKMPSTDGSLTIVPSTFLPGGKIILIISKLAST